MTPIRNLVEELNSLDEVKIGPGNAADILKRNVGVYQRLKNKRSSKAQSIASIIKRAHEVLKRRGKAKPGAEHDVPMTPKDAKDASFRLRRDVKAAGNLLGKAPKRLARSAKVVSSMVAGLGDALKRVAAASMVKNSFKRGDAMEDATNDLRDVGNDVDSALEGMEAKIQSQLEKSPRNAEELMDYADELDDLRQKLAAQVDHVSNAWTSSTQ